MKGTQVQPLRVVGYLRVSTEEQARSGLGLDAQRDAIEAEAHHRGWDLVEIVVDPGVSGTRVHDRRPGFRRVLDLLEVGEADAVVAAKLDRFGRRLDHQCALIERASRDGWGLIALDVDLDTTTAAGLLVANVLGAVSQHFRDVISERTREALAQRRAQGVQLGRPRLLDRKLADRIREERRDGATFRAIADRLNDEGVLTATGRMWSPASIRKVTLQQPHLA